MGLFYCPAWWIIENQLRKKRYRVLYVRFIMTVVIHPRVTMLRPSFLAADRSTLCLGYKHRLHWPAWEETDGVSKKQQDTSQRVREQGGLSRSSLNPLGPQPPTTGTAGPLCSEVLVLRIQTYVQWDTDGMHFHHQAAVTAITIKHALMAYKWSTKSSMVRPASK